VRKSEQCYRNRKRTKIENRRKDSLTEQERQTFSQLRRSEHIYELLGKLPRRLFGKADDYRRSNLAARESTSPELLPRLRPAQTGSDMKRFTGYPLVSSR
jgi:hypothetical protein